MPIKKQHRRTPPKSQGANNSKKVEQIKEALQARFNKERAEIRLRKQKLVEELINLTNWYKTALRKAYDHYKENWNTSCEGLGLKPDSALPKDIASHIEDRYQKDIEFLNKEFQSQKDDLFKLYE